MKIEQKKNTKRPLYATGTAILATTMILSGCSLTTPTTTTSELQLEGEPTTADYYSYNVVNGCKYEYLGSELYGPKLDRGWYIRDAGAEKYIVICGGKDYPEGQYLDAEDVYSDRNDYDTVVISVKGTRAKGEVTDDTPYPCCYVGFDKIPDKVRIHSYDGINYEFGGYIIDTEVWAIDVPIDKDYKAVFQKDGNLTYIYEMEDGKYRYINALTFRTSRQNPGKNEFVKGSGTVDSISALERVCTLFDSFEYVKVNGDEENKIKAEDYIKMLSGDEV